jgi:YfiH family protein
MITLPELNDLATIRHGFATRPAGVSQGLYRGLNCGLGSRDNPDNIHENRRIAADKLGFSADRLVTLYQVHSPDIITVTEPWAATDAPKADGMVTKIPKIILGVLAADCAPLIFVDPIAGVIGACHAGWRGAIGGVAEATLIAMQNLGAANDQIIAAIGPCIGANSYEVSDDFILPFRAQDDENEKFFYPGAAQKLFFDLPGYLAHRLFKVGINRVLLSGLDTLRDEENFFSYRRSTLRQEPDYGRNISMIALNT